jgi:hypothetical protein
LRYEVCCTLAALRSVGVVGHTERWVVIATPEWTDALSRYFPPDQLLAMTKALNQDQFQQLCRTLRRGPASSVVRASRSDTDSCAEPTESRPAAATPNALSEQGGTRAAKTGRLHRGGTGTRADLNAT